VVINSSGTTVEKSHYYPFGMRFFPESTSNSAAIGFRYNGKEFETMNGLNRYDYGKRMYDPALARWHVADPRAEKYYDLSPYNYCANNPIIFIDPQGDTIVVNNTGYITRNDETDNFVYMQDGDNFTQIGELGKEIDANTIYSNLMEKSAKEAKGTWNPLTFKNNVKTGGKWDLKNDKTSIFGLGNDGKTTFGFDGNSMESQDIGNHHFGVVAEAYGLFPSEEFVLKQAGDYQIKSGTSKPEWQQYKEVSTTYVSPTGMPMTTTSKVMLPPYGDDPRDQKWIKSGFQYFNTKLK